MNKSIHSVTKFRSIYGGNGKYSIPSPVRINGLPVTRRVSLFSVGHKSKFYLVAVKWTNENGLCEFTKLTTNPNIRWLVIVDDYKGELQPKAIDNQSVTEE